jgi:radical SAM superfamily enzyme YgiQ (UPF0313 family)
VGNVHSEDVAVLLISTYDLGRQPFGLASPAAWLKRAGFEVIARDLSREPLEDDDVARAECVGFYLPMHTATRLALPVIAQIRANRPLAPLCAYGLYAPLNASLLRECGVSDVFGPEAEDDLVRWAEGAKGAEGAGSAEGAEGAGAKGPEGAKGADGAGGAESAAVLAGKGNGRPARVLPRLEFITPDRTGLPSLNRYAAVQLPDGSRRVAGATDATRGCKHRCRHCPIVPVYDGQFRVVAVDTVLADVDQQVTMGAEHITFGDPDFFNGPSHARRIVEAFHARHPQVSYDVTIKVEHLLRHRDLLPTLAATGCLFVTSAVEAVDDGILEKFEKRHTRADFEEAVRLTRAAGLTLAPTFVAFTPWTTLDGYRDLLDTVARLDLVDHVAPVQWGLRLLITHGSRLLELDDIATAVGDFDATSLTYPWRHADARVDALQKTVANLVGVRANRTRAAIFAEIGSIVSADVPPQRARAAIPYVDEPWYC